MKKFLLLVGSLITVFNGLYAQTGPCLGSQTLTASPAPGPGGVYFPGQVVTFCYTATDYLQTGVDWICGIVPSMGPGWDTTTLQPISASPSCDGQGNWAWYTSCTSTNSGLTFGPGFYYDTPAGSTSGTLDGIPGNNFGDNCTVFSWTFCFSAMISLTAPSGTDASVCVTAYPDNVVGSWGTPGCVDPCSPPVTAVVANCNLIVTQVTVTDATCPGSTDGSITVIPSGLPPYTYLWSNGATSATITNLASGIYTVTVTDSSSCQKVVTIPVGGPQPYNYNAVVIPDGCDTTGGSVTLNLTGGSGPYTYQWSNGSTLSAITGLTGGTYTVTVTDANSCTGTTTFTINTSIPISLTTSSTPASCGVANGSASVIASGGAPPFTYSWSPTGGNLPSAINLNSGTYTVTVTDTAGCTASAQIAVPGLSTFTLSTQFVPLNCDPSDTTTATVNITGGAPPFTFQWFPTGGSGQTGTGLTAGTYTVTVTDSSGCIDSATVVIPPVVPVSVTVTSTPVQCNSTNTGTVSASASGGNGTFTYLWSDGSTTATVSGLAGGLYTVTVTDGSGCTATTSVTVGLNPDVFVSAGSDTTICSGQSVSINGSATGGTAPFSYQWSNSFSGQSQTVNPTNTTSYTVTVTDANNCTASSTVNINVVQYPVVTVSPDMNICYGESVNLTASGGDTYSWAPAAGLSDPLVASPVASPTATTTYTVTVSTSGCSSTGSITVNVSSQIIAAFSPDSVQGDAPFQVNFTNNSTGATGYTWNFGDGTSSTDANPSHTYTGQGNYTVILTAVNADGCTDTLAFTFIIVNEFSALQIPNIFTPNGDGKNDTFAFIENGIVTINVVIMNRWGNEVYSWSKLKGSWDGKISGAGDAPDGVYFYVIKARGIDGKLYVYDGTVQLIRNK